MSVLITTIRWGHSHWTVKYDDALTDSDSIGRTSYSENTLSLMPGMPIDRTLETFWHELTHMILGTGGLQDLPQIEQVCDIMSFGLATLFADNEHLSNIEGACLSAASEEE